MRLREIEFETRSGAQRRLHVNVAGALVDDAIDGGQAESGTFSWIFCGEERLKDAGSDIGSHAAAGVSDSKHDVRPGLYGWMHCGIARIHGDVVSFDEKRAASRHGVGGVYGEVEENLLDLPGIGE